MVKKIIFLMAVASLAGILLAQSPPAPTGDPALDELVRKKLREFERTNQSPARPGPPVLRAAPASQPAAPVIQQAPAAQAQAQPPQAPAVPPAPAPPQLQPPAFPPAPGAPDAAAAKPAEPEPMFGGEVNFKNMDLLQALDFYASELVNRTILRAATLPAAQISLTFQTPLTRTEAIQAFDTVFTLNGITIIPTGEKFITVVPSAQALQEAAAFSTLSAGELPEAAQFITQIVQLKQARPSEIVTAIQPFARNPAGIVPIDTTQMLILRDTANNVKRMLEVIEKVDVEVPLEIELELIPIKYALAADIASVLGSLTTGGVSGGTTSSRTSSTRRPTSTTVGQPGFPGSTPQPGQPGFNPLQTRTGTPGAPTTSAAGATSTFQRSLQQIVSRAASGGEAPLLGDAKIIPDERTNALLIFGTRQERQMVKNIIEKLDVVQAQVLIEAIIMEVSLDDTFNFGVSATQNRQQTGRLSGAGILNNPSQGLSFLNPQNLIGATNFTSAPGGFSYFAKWGGDFDVALNAIATDGSINVLSRPRIQTSHAVEASLFVGNTVPFITGTFTDITGGGRSQFQNQQVGITLSVLPIINIDGLVVMDIMQQVQQLGTPTIIDGNPVPTTTERNATAKVAVKDGDTIILGGFISSIKSKAKSGVPFLKDIPGIGALFRSRSDSNQRVELIVMIRPTVLPTPGDAAITASIEREKLSGVKRAEVEIREEELKRSEKIEAELKKKETEAQRAPQERY